MIRIKHIASAYCIKCKKEHKLDEYVYNQGEVVPRYDLPGGWFAIGFSNFQFSNVTICPDHKVYIENGKIIIDGDGFNY